MIGRIRQRRPRATRHASPYYRAQQDFVDPEVEFQSPYRKGSRDHTNYCLGWFHAWQDKCDPPPGENLAPHMRGRGYTAYKNTDTPSPIDGDG